MSELLLSLVVTLKDKVLYNFLILLSIIGVYYTFNKKVRISGVKVINAILAVGTLAWLLCLLIPFLFNLPQPAMTGEGTAKQSVTEPYQVRIASPVEGEEVPLTHEVKGTFAGKLPEGYYLWVVVNPQVSPDAWWPQAGRLEIWKGEWRTSATFGEQKKGIGEKFDIYAVMVNEQDDRYYRDYLISGGKDGKFPAIPLVSSAKKIDRITVIRK